MKHNQFALLKDRRFAPLFVAQFLGAFHDNLFKNALVVMLLYGVGIQAVDNPELLVTLAAGLFILPFIIFSALGGQLADKFPKHRVIRIIKLAEVGIALFGVIALFTGSVVFSFVVLFTLGAQSAFFGPSKYSILPQHLKTDELIGGNALLNTGTFLAILFGTIAGTVLITLDAGKFLVCGALVLCAVCGYVASRFIPEALPKARDLKLDFNPLTETFDILKYTFGQKRMVVQAILGVAWFYFLGGMFMAQMPNYTEGTLGANEHVLALFLVIFSVGIAVGGLLNNRLLHGRIEAVYVPLAALGITVFSTDLYFANGAARHSLEGLWDVRAFLSFPAHWRIIFGITMIALCGGLYVVPLNAIIQHFTDEEHRSRIMAGSAILNAIFVTGSSVFSAVLIARSWEIKEIFLVFAIMNAGVGLYICKLLPAYLMKGRLQALFKFLQ